MAIQVLDQNTINQIAAGEVVERPASVVKELMENAIDAGSSAVTVEIRDGGIGFIRITDNGCGIEKSELPLAFLRHATSKIRTAEDLLTVSSLGFRGEALSSIAAVSQVELITKTSASFMGARYVIEGGKEKSIEDVGAPDGTTIISRNLFYNTPARRKFLKTAPTEAAHVADLAEKIALSHPEISIRLIVNNQTKLHTAGNNNLKDIIYTVYGREITANLIPVETVSDTVRISGFIGKPVIARSNRNFECYFINGRYIKSGIISRAIEDGYKSFMMQHKYPFTMLKVEVEPEYIDVNVHPSKMELRFRNGEEIYGLICSAVSQALSGQELIPQVEPEDRRRPGPESQDRSDAGAAVKSAAKVPTERPERASGTETKKPSRAPEPFEVKRLAAMKDAEHRADAGTEKAAQGSDGMDRPRRDAYRSHTDAGDRTAVMEDRAPYHAGPSGKKDGQLSMFDGRLLSEQARSRHRLIGQVFDTYWIVEYNDQLYIIDQHAAHEKVLFEKNFASLKSREFTSQLLSPPVILTLSMQEADLLNRHMDVFREIGFEIDPFGGSEYAIRAVPDNLLSLAQKDLFLELLDSLSDDVARAGSETIYDRIATMSCKAAVKGNNRMSPREADELIDQLLKLDNPYTCPHGRPTIIAMSRTDLEKKFKRIV